MPLPKGINLEVGGTGWKSVGSRRWCGCHFKKSAVFISTLLRTAWGRSRLSGSGQPAEKCNERTAAVQQLLGPLGFVKAACGSYNALINARTGLT
jgi:hypothetical protein